MSARGPIGWYAHHHGRGHIARFEAVAEHLREPPTLLTSYLGEAGGFAERIQLPLDLPREGERAGPGAFFAHYAPTGVSGLSERMAALAAWIAAERPALLVVDVSCEVAMLARLCGIPTAIVRQQGDRDDLPHRLAHRSAELLLAPWPRWFGGHLDEPAATLERTVFTGGFSRFDGRPREDDERPGGRRRLLVLPGGGGSSLRHGLCEEWAAALPDWQIDVVGIDVMTPSSRSNMSALGWVADPWPLLCRADAVISHAGHNAVMEAAAAAAPLIAVAEARPFDEQIAKAVALESSNTAIGVLGGWPDPGELAGHLEALERRRPDIALLSDGAGAARAAAAIDSAAGHLSSSRSSSGPGLRRSSSNLPSGSQAIQPRRSNSPSHPSIGHRPQRL